MIRSKSSAILKKKTFRHKAGDRACVEGMGVLACARLWSGYLLGHNPHAQVLGTRLKKKKKNGKLYAK
jgi:hypothetical protein